MGIVTDMDRTLPVYFGHTPDEFIVYAQSIQDYFDANMPFEVVQVRVLPLGWAVRVELVSHDNFFTIYRLPPKVNEPIIVELLRHYLRRIERIRDGEPEEMFLEPQSGPLLKPERVQNIPLAPVAQGHIYVIRGGDLYKIGVSLHPNQRLNQLNSGSPVALSFEICEPHSDMFVGEAELHARFDKQRIKGEWFALTDSDLVEIREFLSKSNGNGK